MDDAAVNAMPWCVQPGTWVWFASVCNVLAWHHLGMALLHDVQSRAGLKATCVFVANTYVPVWYEVRMLCSICLHSDMALLYHFVA